MRINFVTGHHAVQKRKTGFHFWADILIAQGHEVRWISVGKSLLSAFKKNSAEDAPSTPYNKWVDIKPGLRSFIWRPFFHPVNLGRLNGPLSFAFDLYPKQMPHRLIEMIKSDVFIIDSGAALMMTESLRRFCPKARIVYFASDRMTTLNAHPAVAGAQEKALAHIDLVRVVSEECLADFQNHPKVRYIPQGIDKDAFHNESVNPYTSEKNIVCAGDMLFDASCVEIMAGLFPDIQFHLFGRNAHLNKLMTNVIEYGERAFEDIVPYLQHADMGIAPYGIAEGANYFAQSGLKIAQYTYCRLPVVLPDTIARKSDHMISYRHNDKESIRRAIETAMSYKRDSIDRSHIPGWNDVINQILVEAGAMDE